MNGRFYLLSQKIAHLFESVAIWGLFASILWGYPKLNSLLQQLLSKTQLLSWYIVCWSNFFFVYSGRMKSLFFAIYTDAPESWSSSQRGSKGLLVSSKSVILMSCVFIDSFSFYCFLFRFLLIIFSSLLRRSWIWSLVRLEVFYYAQELWLFPC